MFTSSVEVVIARPVDEVFAFVSDARNRPSWDDSVQSEELTSPEPIGVGSTVRTRMRSMGRDAPNPAVMEHDGVEDSEGKLEHKLRRAWEIVSGRG
jgi:Polyketide cyclase / dehydrase and lipid transport